MWMGKIIPFLNLSKRFCKIKNHCSVNGTYHVQLTEIQIIFKYYSFGKTSVGIRKKDYGYDCISSSWGRVKEFGGFGGSYVNEFIDCQ
jgi:hypothetical protein